MDKEKLIIKNFGGFEYIEFDFKPINIFIGPQAAGKSIVIKLAYYFKSFLADLIRLDSLNTPPKLVVKNYHSKFQEYFPIESWNNKSFSLKYKINTLTINIEGSKKHQSFTIGFSDSIKKIVQQIDEIYDDEPVVIGQINLSKLDRLNKLERAIKLPNYISNKQYFIPAGRSFFSNIQSNIFTLLQGNNTIDPFLIEFGANYERAKNIYNKSSSVIFKENNLLSKYIYNILAGKYVRENEIDYLIQKDQRKIALVNVSSGQQETFPLLMFLQSFYIPSNNKDKDISTYIEEPETHLYPTSQKQIVEVLARFFYSTKSQLFITTHSPYILAAFNNLIEAGNIIQNKPELADKVYNIIPKEEVLKAENLIAYSIKDGKKTVLLDEENNLISQNILDDVSNEIGAEFGKLLDLEFGI